MDTSSNKHINQRYLSGISDEPKQLLEPISGYAHEPLLSLEEACEPLLNIVSRLPVHIWIAKQNSTNPTDDLTQDESAAIRLYTMEWDSNTKAANGSLYAHLNRNLKEIDRTKLHPWFRYLKLFLTALAKLPVAPRQTVWRGLHLNLSKDYLPGDKITWWAFSSCTTSLNVLESNLYLGNVGTRTLFSIEAINGRTIRAHSHFTTEDEILLLPGTYLEVKSQLNPAPDLYIIHLQQRIPPHALLEPPFAGAQLFSLSEIDQAMFKDTILQNNKYNSRPWYKNNKIRFGLVAVLAVVILAVILGATLGTRNKTQTETSSSTTSTSQYILITLVFYKEEQYFLSPLLIATEASSFYNQTLADPVSVANAFYAFDGNLFDLYSQRNGEVVGGSISYIQGYVAYGQAIVLNQSIPTQINVKPNFDFNVSSSFTIEGFFMLRKTQLNATLIQLMPFISMNLINGVLAASLGSNITLLGTSVISTNQWHHFSFVFDSIQQITTISIDGTVEKTQSSIEPVIPLNNSKSIIIIGAGFHGYIDQLSISLKAKSRQAILWDATVAAYYPLDVSWLLDKGPNGLNATASDVIPIYGWHYNALNFNKSGAYYEASGFTVLGTPRHAFSIALWVRAETQPGIFLTVANPYTCLLVLGFQNDSNTLVAYLPNATATGDSVNIIGPQMPSNAWVHVAFTWSTEHLAKLYTSSYLQGESGEARTLNNARGDHNSSPMTITLGKYNGAANCEGIEGISTSQTFMGSLDEMFVFARELQDNDLAQIIKP
ncbi:unnamed protein product [Rotaria sp. Silwood2]|nr:unnamed protein product [Rotaria sp. Silwood2]